METKFEKKMYVLYKHTFFFSQSNELFKWQWKGNPENICTNSVPKDMTSEMLLCRYNERLFNWKQLIDEHQRDNGFPQRSALLIKRLEKARWMHLD